MSAVYSGITMHRDIWEKLRHARIFASLDKSTRSQIIDSSRQQSLSVGTSLWRQGDAPDTIAVVTGGRLRMVTVDPQGVQKTLHYMDPGDLVGCAAVFGRFPYPATAAAVEATNLLCWSADRFEALTQAYPILATNVLAIMGRRTGEILRRLHEATGENADRRIARVLLRLIGEQFGDAPGSTFEIRVSRQELAELSDTTLFTVSRMIAAWDRLEIIRAGRGRLIICDASRLAALAGV